MQQNRLCSIWKKGGWERDERRQNDFSILSWDGTRRRTVWAYQSNKFKSKAPFTAVWWKGSKCLAVYVLWFLVDLDCDIWRSPCLYVSSGMDWQLWRHSMSELGDKYRGGAGEPGHEMGKWGEKLSNIPHWAALKTLSSSVHTKIKKRKAFRAGHMTPQQ